MHGVIVDSSVVFPHKRGPPLKRALKNLVSENLHREIQTPNNGWFQLIIF